MSAVGPGLGSTAFSGIQSRTVGLNNANTPERLDGVYEDGAADLPNASNGDNAPKVAKLVELHVISSYVE